MYPHSDHNLMRADHSSGSTIEISLPSPVHITWVVAIKIGKRCLSVDVAIANSDSSSGFEGPWTFSRITVTNDYFKLLFDETWVWRKWDGPKQLEDKKTRSLMMLP